MLIALDIGNTEIVAGVYEGSALRNHWRVSTERRKTADEYGILFLSLMDHGGLDPDLLDSAIIASVVPPLTQTLEDTCSRYLRVQPIVVGPGVKTGVSVKYENPKEVGADRIVNAVAAYDRYGAPAIVVDFGTATTYDAISRDGEYLGGAIAPGIGISLEALFQRAAKLPRIELVKPPSVVGRNTVSSMQSGIVFGFAGQVDEIVRRMREEIGGDAFVVATGGLAELIAPETRTIQKVDRLLTLWGLRVIHQRNRPD
ncbi:MAG: type III pantothenate kinase [Bacillota bacterium]